MESRSRLQLAVHLWILNYSLYGFCCFHPTVFISFTVPAEITLASSPHVVHATRPTQNTQCPEPLCETRMNHLTDSVFIKLNTTRVNKWKFRLSDERASFIIIFFLIQHMLPLYLWIWRWVYICVMYISTLVYVTKNLDLLLIILLIFVFRTKQ